MERTPEQVLEEARALIADAKSEDDFESARIKYLGRNGEVTALLKSMGQIPAEERKEYGKVANAVKQEITELINGGKARALAESRAAKLMSERIDVSEPGTDIPFGALHPITQTIDEISRIFIGLGYSITEGPEADTVFHNFDALNAAPNHPSRDLSDTFYITEDTLLRTQTSPVQVRTLMSSEPPIKVISPGRCFRADTPDATHSPMFHQVEGLLVDEGVTMADLKGTLDAFAKRMFGSGVATKFRPHFFPFTEPSAEMDMSCFVCGGEGCRVCKGSGWIEILGCGMVHPNVLKVGGLDTERYTGFAFGMGVERIAMLKHGIDDIRLFYENDVRFIGQFA
ncbi:MAG: phenylalanine--tRNA ligase subunit alpha [Clostridiales Family XIII bacterium]|jgi:phenylalanyl-tRNA synthetase alpha chain|nr:phenylalanine--tRNA ligase subunit alpha [Clostridiales Family XIII bacterium]